jgi:GTPase-activating protein SAC7
MDWGEEGFSVYEAADLILTFLRELPQPLVSESVVKRWIVLSRQATVSGSLALRLDQGLDFWEEAFTGLRGSARALFKLLLGLWGEVAEASDVNDMTAERLAGRVMGPLMHGNEKGNGTDMLLGLAFIIRKRAEYNVKLKGGGKSKAAF